MSTGTRLSAPPVAPGPRDRSDTSGCVATAAPHPPPARSVATGAPPRRLLGRAGSPRRRVRLLRTIVVLVSVAFAGRLVWVQRVDAERYVALGDSQRDGRRELPAERGQILDRSGDQLAASAPRPTLFVNPSAVSDVTGLAAALAPLVGVDAATLAERLTVGRDEGRQFTYLARQVDDATAASVLALEHPAVGVIDEPRRVHPGGDLGRSLLGTVDLDHAGVSGVELLVDDELNGRPGRITFERSATGDVIPTGHSHTELAEPGDDVVLTIDRHLQWVTEDVLRDVVDGYDAAGAMAVVLETDTAHVLAMASVEGGRARGDGGSAAVAGYNMAAVDVFEPGSISKVFSVGAVLEEGLTTPDEMIDVPPSLVLYDVEIGDDHASETGSMTTAEIVQQSSNVGTVRLTQRLGERRFAEYLESFGFGNRTGVGGAEQFPGESRGSLMAVEDWNAATLPTVSYGQGIGVTVLQMAAAYNVIANDGLYRTPIIVAGTVGDDEEVAPVFSVAEHQVLSPDTAATLREVMAGVVDGRGTGSRAAVPGYEVAGKTGTARKPDLERGGYLAESWIATFAGFAPVEDPAVTVVVVVDDPRGEYYGGLVAAPVFQQLAEYSLRLLRVAPTRPVSVASDPSASHGDPAGGNGGPAATAADLGAVGAPEPSG